MTSLAMARLAYTSRLTARSTLAGLGIYLPAADLPSAPHRAGTECKGVSDRVEAGVGITTPSLAAGAAKAALEAAGESPSEVDLVVVGTTSPDVLWPSTACLVQTELGLRTIASFDIYAAEAGLLTALVVADRYVASGLRSALVIGAESDNQLVQVPSRPGGRRGRAAAAALLRSANNGGALLASVIGGSARLDLDNNEQSLISGLNGAVRDCLERASLALAQIDLVIAEQTAPEVMQAWALMSGVRPDRLLLDPQRYWAAFTTAPLFALHDAVESGRLKAGMSALLLSCGRGPEWAVVCLRWGDGRTRAW